jgi:hypothetical protein
MRGTERLGIVTSGHHFLRDWSGGLAAFRYYAVSCGRYVATTLTWGGPIWKSAGRPLWEAQEPGCRPAGQQWSVMF